MKKSSGCGWGYKGISIFIISFLLLTVFAFCGYAEEIDDIRAAIQEKGLNWVAEENELSLLPLEEKIKRLGILEGEDKAYLAAEPAPLPDSNLTALDPYLDWRNYNGYNYVTPIKNQGSCGSCWAFSSTAAIESKILINKGVSVNLSEQVLVSCSGAGSCSGGYEGYAANYLKYTGIPLESCYPYTTSNGNCPDACPARLGQSYKISNWGYVSANVTAIKTAIATYGPVVARFAVYSDFYNYKSGVYSYAYGGYCGLHAILVVGYDDYNNCFIVKNSWGSNWGERGYFRINYNQVGSYPVYFGSQVEAYYNGIFPWDSCTDPYEPNDDSNSAYTIASGGTYNGRICSPDDLDWFNINVSSPGVITLTLNVPSSNDYDIQLYNPAGKRVAFSDNTMGLAEYISWAAGITGAYKVPVYGYNKDYNTSAAYSLYYSFTPIGINLAAPNGAHYDGCWYYSPPTFTWSTYGDTSYFKTEEIQFSALPDFSTYTKVSLVLGSTTFTPTAAVWKKIMLLPGAAGGTVYWRVKATMTDKGLAYSNVYSFTINAPAPVTGFGISPVSKSSLTMPTISWDENCNKKFKVWFGSAADFTLTTTKKKALTFNDTVPTDNGGVFSQLLTSGQWKAIRGVVVDVAGSNIYYYVEAWDAVNRHSVTGVSSFTLAP